MPTPKQTRLHYKKCRRYFWLLLQALTKAHDLEVINYEKKYDANTKIWKDSLPSVCDAVYIAKENFENATLKSRAQAFKEEAMSELKGNVW